MRPATPCRRSLGSASLRQSVVRRGIDHSGRRPGEKHLGPVVLTQNATSRSAIVVSPPTVDLCVNCYERTYREVLKPGFFPALVAEHRHAFARRTAIINNVNDREDAQL